MSKYTSTAKSRINQKNGKCNNEEKEVHEDADEDN